MKRLAVLLLVSLAACTWQESIQGTGQRADPPGGWTAYCDRNPKDPSCPPSTQTTTKPTK